MALWAWHFYDLSQTLLSIVGAFPLTLMHSTSGCYFNGFTLTLQINMMGAGWASLANTHPCKSCPLSQGFRFVYFLHGSSLSALFALLTVTAWAGAAGPIRADPAPQVVVPHLLSHGQGCKTSSHTSTACIPHILCGKAFLGSDLAFATSHAHISPWCSSVLIKTPLLPQVQGLGGNWGAEVTGLVQADEGSCNQKYE